ncbi:MAG: sulfite exporter TauE/SafE family protein [Ginsengibacter sp.]
MISTFFISALFIGFLGSFHCVGMCGPIALSLPVSHLQGFEKAMGIGLYNLGRVIMYALIGMIFGMVGLSFKYFGWQQILSIALGAVLILIFLSRVFSFKKNRIFSIFPPWNRKVILILTPLMTSGKTKNLLFIGLLNGLLPCGLIYIALAGAMATGNIFYSALFMAGFGAGTLPAMVIASYAAGMISIPVRNKIKKVFPYMLAVMGILLILRGLNLDIPFLSPALHGSEGVSCH